MEKNYYVYIHTFPNNKKYVGITSQKPEQRWGKDGKGYRRKNKGKYAQSLMARATLKYNWDDILHEVVAEGLTKSEAEQMEIELIAKYRSNEREFGYNISAGGNVTSLSDSTKKKISKALKGRDVHNKGKKLSEEGRKKLSEAHKGKKPSEGTRKKMSESSSQKKAIRCIETGIVYESIKAAADDIGIHYSNISNVCNGKRKSAGKLHWEYVEAA